MDRDDGQAVELGLWGCGDGGGGGGDVEGVGGYDSGRGRDCGGGGE